MSKKLVGKTALILGGTSGMGLAAAKLFLEQGAKLIITGRKQSKIDTATEQLSGEYVIYQADIGDFSATQEAIKKGVEKFGNLDIIYQVAGVSTPAPVMMADPQHYEDVIRINLLGPIMAILNSREYLNDGASIILTSSTFSSRTAPMMSSYGASKAGLEQFGRVLSLEMAARQIRVNNIKPGATDTPLFDDLGFSPEEIAGWKGFMTMITPLQKMGQPEDVAKLALFLASDDSSQITGTSIDVDGGINQSWHLIPEG